MGTNMHLFIDMKIFVNILIPHISVS